MVTMVTSHHIMVTSRDAPISFKFILATEVEGAFRSYRQISDLIDTAIVYFDGTLVDIYTKKTNCS